jgi:hypothetical protein
MDYQPKIIIREEQYQEYLLDLHRTLGHIAINRDPPNPFRSLLEEGDNLKIIVNDTNDLRHCIKEFEQKILDGDLENVIIGDPHTFGYGFELLDKMIEDVEVPIHYFKDKHWITVMINIDNKNLVIEQSRIKVE